MQAKQIKQRTMNELRGILANEIDRLLNKKTTPLRANTVARVCQTYVSTVAVELKYADLTDQVPVLDFMEENMKQKAKK